MHLDPDLLAALNDALGNSIGIHFESDRLADLEKAVIATALELGYSPEEISQFGSRVCQYATTAEELELIARHLTVGETYFFREARVFKELARLLPGLLKERLEQKVFRVWSAGCCTGEEAYSLAILLCTVIAEHSNLGHLSDWQIEIYASDINKTYLQKAEKALYSAWSFRGEAVNDQLKSQFFTREEDGNFMVADAIKKMVHFSYLNLADDYSYIEALKTVPLDLVLCRNVLIYFSSKIAAAVLQRLRQCLAPKGWLLLASSDLPASSLNGLFQKLSVCPDNIPLFQRLEIDHISSNKNIIRPAAAEEQKYDLEFARKLMRQGQYQNSERIVDMALAKLSGSDKRRMDNNLQCQLLELKVKLLSNQGSLAQACHQASLLVALQNNYNYLYLYAMVLSENGEKSRAEDILRQALRKKPDFSAALLMYSSLLRQRGENALAQEQLCNLRTTLLKLKADEIVDCTGELTAKELMATVEQLLGDS